MKSKNDKADFWWLAGILATLITTFSIVTLIQYGIRTGDLSAPIQAIIDAYNEGIAKVFTLFEPYLASAVSRIASLIDIDVELHSHWRHIFLLLMLGWAASTRFVARTSNLTWTAIWVVCGFLASIVSALAVGTLLLETDNPLTEWLVFIIPFSNLPLAGALIGITPFFTSPMWSRLFFSLWIAGIIAVLIFGIDKMPPIQEISGTTVPSPGLLLTGLYMLTLALILLIGGALEGLIFQRNRGQPFYSSIWRNPGFRIGLVMVGGFVGAAVLFATSAVISS